MLDKLKGALRSKTIWFNVFMVALPEIFEQLQANLPVLHDYLPENTYKAVGLVAIVGNVILRGVTKIPLEAK